MSENTTGDESIAVTPDHAEPVLPPNVPVMGAERYAALTKLWERKVLIQSQGFQVSEHLAALESQKTALGAQLEENGVVLASSQANLISHREEIVKIDELVRVEWMESLADHGLEGDHVIILSEPHYILTPAEHAAYEASINPKVSDANEESVIQEDSIGQEGITGEFESSVIN